MATRNVVLTAHQQGLIDKLVKTGRYQNASEVLREGLRLIEQRELREAAKLTVLQAAALAGFADLDHGRYCEVRDDELEDFIGNLGRHASDQIRTAGE